MCIFYTYIYTHSLIIYYIRNFESYIYTHIYTYTLQYLLIIFNNGAIIPNKNSTTVAAPQLGKCFENNHSAISCKKMQHVHTHIHDFVYYLDKL